ncbi:hypothetical protein GRX03_02155 [Halovenus sp. WSH3]|uniref:Uncharacterized protein n=1 Tax=Halovenus carboxidivorans TaxID=2692199 RepID=A0A6B0T5A0_9EURY|nr:hypothetical protein [Halovenus carboxidivorans]MXR50411.1 hypothetical protein [Halovenus carboxidivorans]
MFTPSTSDNDAQTNLTRRRVLLGIGAATVTVAGCASSEADNDDPSTGSFDPASALPYGKWLTTAGDGMLFAYADLEAVPTNAASSAATTGSLGDPLVTYPLVLNQTTVGLGKVQLSIAGLTRAFATNTPSDSTITEMTVVNKTVVAKGTFATDKLDQRLTESAGGRSRVTYEKTGTTRGYDRYEPTDVPESFTEDPPVVGVTAETVVAGPNTEQLERMLAAGDGAQSRIYEESETVTQLLEQAGTGDLVVGEIGSRQGDGFAPREAFEISPQFQPRTGEDVVASLVFAEDGSTVESQFALAADDLSESRRESIRTAFGKTAVSGSVSLMVNDSQLTVSGTYNTTSIGLTNNDSGKNELSRSATAKLVSPDALAFQYEPPRDQQFGEFWVTPTEPTEAAALRLEADSGASTEFRPQEGTVGANDSIAVPVDPAGDSVTVSVVNEEGAVGELTTQSVPTADLSETAATRAVPEDALSFSYESPSGGDFGSLTIDVVADTGADTLVAQPQSAPGLFTDRVGSLASDESVGAGTTLETAVDPTGGEVIVYASVDDATGEVARWQRSQ